MAYLGQVMFIRPLRELLWTNTIIPETIIGVIIGQYATYGGYIFVNNGGGTGETSFDGGGP